MTSLRFDQKHPVLGIARTHIDNGEPEAAYNLLGTFIKQCSFFCKAKKPAKLLQAEALQNMALGAPRPTHVAPNHSSATHLTPPSYNEALAGDNVWPGNNSDAPQPAAAPVKKQSTPSPAFASSSRQTQGQSVYATQARPVQAGPSTTRTNPALINRAGNPYVGYNTGNVGTNRLQGPTLPPFPNAGIGTGLGGSSIATEFARMDLQLDAQEAELEADIDLMEGNFVGAALEENRAVRDEIAAASLGGGLGYANRVGVGNQVAAMELQMQGQMAQNAAELDFATGNVDAGLVEEEIAMQSQLAAAAVSGGGLGYRRNYGVGGVGLGLGAGAALAEVAAAEMVEDTVIAEEVFDNRSNYSHNSNRSNGYYDNGNNWSNNGNNWSNNGNNWSNNGNNWSDNGNNWSDNGNNWSDNGNSWGDGGNNWSDNGNSWGDGGNNNFGDGGF